ncbi:MAG: class I SAM-dependent methyltransferase [Halobacteriales archaeon]
MSERLYTEHPELYDLIQSGWDYDCDVAFVLDALGRDEGDGARLLEVGCGTGEHTRRFVDVGFDVTALDKHEGMLSVAGEKCDADVRQEALPDLAVGGAFDAVVAIRGVINHLAPADLDPAIGALAARVADGGVLVFDNAPLPPEGNHPAIDVGTTPDGEYGRIAQHVPREDGRLDWNAITVGPEGTVVVNSRPMTPFEDATIAAALDRAGLTVETVEGYGPDDDRTVFVATA